MQKQPLDPPSISITYVSTTSLFTKDSVVTDFPMVFDGIVRAMDGEQFHIHLSVTSPRSIPSAYRDKLAAELTLLQIITPVTEPTDWCAPIVVTPKKNSDSIRMCVDFITSEPFRQERKISVVFSCRSCSQHGCKQCQVLHNSRCEEGISSVPPRPTKPIFDYFHYPLWEV